MRSSPDPSEFKPPRRGLSRLFDTNSRDEIRQRHGRMVHISFVAIPVLPVIVIASPPTTWWEPVLASAASGLATAMGRLVWNYVVQVRRLA